MRRSSATAKHPRRSRAVRFAKLRSCRQGFTILELLLVLMMMALATALVLPNLNPALQGTRREAALKKTVAALDDVRRRAVTSGRILTVTMDEEGKNRLLVAGGGEEEDSFEAIDIPDGAEIVELVPDEARYYPQGHSSGLVLTVKTGRERLHRIEVGSFTGLARIEDGG
ncbi:prepilin-type N-terminal cleavage/methylation domain-containing protein [bacterium]|nr:prepilin-type N-terminal cleavage/methylation domain-containing protein [bacterium]